jgi:hypothetical protein
MNLNQLKSPTSRQEREKWGTLEFLNQGKRAVHGVEDVGHPPLVYYRKALELEKQLTTGY